LRKPAMVSDVGSSLPSLSQVRTTILMLPLLTVFGFPFGTEFKLFACIQRSVLS
jgi:hypothetical protein